MSDEYSHDSTDEAGAVETGNASEAEQTETASELFDNPDPVVED